MKYKKIDISNRPELSFFVDFIYEITNEKNDFIYRTVPNCSIGISVVLSGKAEIFNNSSWAEIPEYTIYGLINSPQLIKMNNSFREIAIGFKPYNLKHLISSPMSEFAGGKTVGLENDINIYELEKFKNNLLKSKNEKSIIQELERFINSISHNYSKKNQSKFAYNLITENNEYSVERLAQELNLSTTSIRNLFNDSIGVSPKELIKSSRIHKVISHQGSSSLNLTDIGLLYGYYDQAHFINDFKSVLGITPKEYFKNDDFGFDFSNYGRWKNSTFVK
ncbi:MAG: AraC-like DNA-binding protein [Urechidicola sp.]|jgi:AraC-like DNA-binding protein